MVADSPFLVAVDLAACATQECGYYTHFIRWGAPERTTHVAHEGYHRLVDQARRHFLACSGSVVRQTPACPTCERWVGRLRW